MNAKPQRYAIVGMKNYVGADALISAAANDHPVVLVREPGNPWDKNAVAVWLKDSEMGWRHVGYVPKTQNQVLSQFIDATGKAWSSPQEVAALAMDAPAQTVRVWKAVEGRLHKGSNQYPLVEVA